jgi:FAD dependent oxidoreductase TIGR03364
VVAVQQNNPPHTADLVVVGAGIVGLAHAADAVLRGMSVVIIERDDQAVGASIRNFGHICITAQADAALQYALAGRDRWLTLGRKAGFGVEECGTTVIARSADELAVLEEFARERGAEQATLLPRQGLEDLPFDLQQILGAAHLPLDLRVDPRAAVPAITAWLATEGATFHWNTTVGEIVDEGRGSVVARTPRGDIRGRTLVHATGHDVDRLYPQVAEEWQVERCRLQMLEVAPPAGRRIDPAILTGLSMLRYNGLSAMPSATAVAQRFAADAPELLEVAMNLMLTQRPDGAIILGDTHHHARTHLPFDEELDAQLLLREGARLFGAPLTVLRRWRGVYATSPRTDFLVAAPSADVRVVSVTSGIGMTTSLGLAPTVLDSF